MKRLLLLLLVGGSVCLQAQQDFIMYNFQEVPQSSYSNPSNRFNGKLYVGVPGISSNYFSLSNSGFAYSDIVRKRRDSLFLDFENLLGVLEDDNYLSFNTKIDLFSIGFSLGGRTQLIFNVTENANLRFSYTKDLMEFVYRGNGAFENEISNFEGLGLSLNHYREYGVGISHQLTDKLRIGGKVKYLYGMENIYSKKTDISLATDDSTYAVTLKADVEIQTSGISDREDDVVSADNLLGKNNNGLAFDFGGHYDFNEKLNFHASVLDLGFIDWNSGNKNYTIANGEYTYDGFETNSFSFGSTSTTDENQNEISFDRILDSLEEDFNVIESKEGYTTPLTGRFYIGANYKLNEKTMVGGIIQSEIFQGEIRPAFSTSVNRKIAKWFTLAASYTIINQSYNNIGFGGYLYIGHVQLYMVSDNFSGAFQPQHARHAQTRFGMNLIFGSEKTKEIHPAFKESMRKQKKEKKKEKEKSESSEEEEA